MKRGDKVYLDGKTACILISNNGLIAWISNGEEKIPVFSMRLRLQKTYYEKDKD